MDETGSGTRVHLLSVKALYSSLSSIYIYIYMVKTMYARGVTSKTGKMVEHGERGMINK